MAEHTEPTSPAVAKKGIGKGPIIGGVVVVAAMAVGGGVALRNAKAHTQAAGAEAPGSAPGGEGAAAGEGAPKGEGAALAEAPQAEPVHEAARRRARL